MTELADFLVGISVNTPNVDAREFCRLGCRAVGVRRPDPYFHQHSDQVVVGAPDAGRAGHFSIALLGRVTNAADLGRYPELSPAAAHGASFLASLVLDNGFEALDAVAGSLAALVFDHQRRALMAWRSPGSECQLFVTSNGAAAAASPDPRALFATSLFDRNLDVEAAADWAAQVPFQGRRSMFAGVHRVLPGELVLVGSGKDMRSLRRWRPRRSTRSFRSVAEAGHALRHTFDQAVAECIPGTAAAGLLLSSGRDSSAVLASAARQGFKIKGFTGAPFPGAPAPAVSGRIADEAERAAGICSAFPAVEHSICRPEPGAILRNLANIHRHAVQPVGNLSNMPWYWAVMQAARDQGCETLLSGTAGNLTISTGGRDFLRDVLVESGPIKAAKAAFSSSGGDPGAWLNLANLVIGPHLPLSLRTGILRAAGRYVPGLLAAPTVAADLRAGAERRLAAAWHDNSPATGFNRRLDVLRDYDAASILQRSFTGIEERDPTRDPRVIEFILSLPPDMLVPHRRVPRPVYAAAFGTDLPPDVVRGSTRGYQGADWNTQFPARDVQKRFLDLLDHPLNRQLFDRDFILGAVANRPTDFRSLIRDDVIDLHRNALLGSLAVADWVAVNFP